MIKENMNILILAGDTAPRAVGGKARNLLALHDAGLQVPAFVIIPHTWFESLLPENSPKDQAPNFDQIRLPAELFLEIKNQFGDKDRFFAVRSSYPEEDSDEHSFAGQFSSRLFVPFDQLHKAILEVWASSASTHVASYQKERGIKAHYFLSVVIQIMVEAEVSGVAFTANPLTGYRNQKVINAVFGIGEGLVSGDLNADQYLVEGETILSKPAIKELAYRFNQNAGAGLRKEPIPVAEQELPCLRDKEILELCHALDRIKGIFGKHQDVEFAFADGLLYLLQARPITSLHRLANINGHYIVWDNSNIIESYPGITSPLTFSYILPLYEKAYRQFMELMGVSSKEIEGNADGFANMLGYLNGRIFYNLRSWYKMIALLPGYSFNARSMEQMMGVKERFDLESADKRSKFRDFFRILRMMYSIVYNLTTLESQKRKFMQGFEEMEKDLKDLDPKALTAFDIMRLYERQEARMLRIWKAPLVNDFFAMIYFGLLKKMVGKAFGEQSNIHNDLLMGVKGIITTEPARMIARMVKQIYAAPKLLDAFQKLTLKQLGHKLSSDPEFKILEEQVNQYIDQFGDRMVGELKLETVTYKQEPERFILVLQNYIRKELRPIRGESGTEVGIRQEAEKQVRAKFRFRPFRKLLLQHVVKQARKLVNGRENLRLYRTRAFGGARTAFRQLGLIFYSEGIIENPDHIFFLTKNEIFDYIKGTSVNYDLNALAKLRKDQFDTFSKEATQSERIKTHGIVYLGNSFFQQQEKSITTGDLQGIGCCRGIVRGRVSVISHPDEIYENPAEIMVTTSTDPGWVTIFPTVSGILVERGSLLSHAAIVCREMGIPCVVGLKDLTSRLKTGDYIEMDGENGTVKILDSHE